MSFLEKEDTEKSSTFWDWVVGIGLVVVIGGFTAFYQYQKRSSTSRFHAADSLFQAGKLKEAGKVYEELKSAQYLTTHDDSIIYSRLDGIETAQEQETALVSDARKKVGANDTAGLAALLGKIPHKELLGAQDQAWVDSLLGTSSVAAKP